MIPYLPPLDSWLECQTCGKQLRRIAKEELHRIARRPENYIMDCEGCMNDNLARTAKEEQRAYDS